MADLRMPDINKVQLAGNLTRDPELKYLPSGMAVCELSLAVNRRYKDKKSGDFREDTMFVNVTLWDKTAEWIGEKVKKGAPVLVEGKLKMDSWEDKNTGQKRNALKVIGDRVQQLAWDDRGGQGGGGGGNYGGGQGGGGQGGGGGYSEAPKPRVIEEPIPEDDIPF